MPRAKTLKPDDRVLTLKVAKIVLPILVQDEVKRQLAILNLRPPFWVRLMLWIKDKWS